MLLRFGRHLIGLYFGRSGVVSGFGAAGSLRVIKAVCDRTESPKPLGE